MEYVDGNDTNITILKRKHDFIPSSVIRDNFWPQISQAYFLPQIKHEYIIQI